jgi:hypothetical protein
MNETIAATGDNSKLFMAASDHLVAGNFNDKFKNHFQYSITCRANKGCGEHEISQLD